MSGIDADFVAGIIANITATMTATMTATFAVTIAIIVLFVVLKYYNITLKRIFSKKKDDLDHFESKVLEKEYVIRNENGEFCKHGEMIIISEKPENIIFEREFNVVNYSYSANLWPGIGLLGTFIGIAFSMLSFTDIDLQNSQAILNSVGGLLNGMSVAFLSSIVGIIVSIHIKKRNQNHQKKIDDLVDIVLKRVNEKYVYESPVLYLRDFNESISKQAEASNVFLKAVKGLKDLPDATKMGETIAQAINSVFISELKPVFEDINEKFSVLGDIKESSRELTEINHKLEKFITHDLEGIFSDIENSFKEANNTISGVNDALTVTNSTLAETREAMITSNENIKQVNTGLEQMVSDMRSVMMDHRETTINLLKETGEQVQSVIEDSNTKLQTTLSGVSNELVATSQRVQDELDKFRETYVNSISDYLQKQGNILEGVLGKQIQELNKSTEKLKANLDEDTHNRMQLNKQYSEYLERMEKITSGQKGVEATVNELMRETTEHFMAQTKEIIEAMNLASDKTQNNFAGSLGKIDSTVADIIKHLTVLLEELNTSVSMKNNQGY